MNRLRTPLAFVLKLVIGVGVLAIVMGRVDLSTVWAAAAGLKLSTIFGVFALYFSAHVVNALKLRLLLPQLSVFQSWRFTMIAVLYGTALPGQLAGDAVKAFRLANASGNAGDMTAAVAAVGVDKVIGMFALLLLTAIGIGLEADTFGANVGLAAVGIMALAIAGLVVVIRAPLPTWLGRWGEGFVAWRTLRLRSAVLVQALGLGLIYQSFSILVFTLLGAGLGIDLAPTVWVVAVGLVSLVLLLPITVAGIGLRDGSLVAVLGLLGHSEGAALALSFSLLGLTLAGAAVGFVADLAGRDR